LSTDYLQIFLKLIDDTTCVTLQYNSLLLYVNSITKCTLRVKSHVLYGELFPTDNTRPPWNIMLTSV